MQKQQDMEKSMLMAHRDFMNNLENSLDSLEKDIQDAKEVSSRCTAEWCTATDHFIDELHKSIYSISEPRWLTEEDSERIHNLRKKVKDLYLEFSKAKESAA